MTPIPHLTLTTLLCLALAACGGGGGGADVAAELDAKRAIRQGAELAAVI